MWNNQKAFNAPIKPDNVTTHDIAQSTKKVPSIFRVIRNRFLKKPFNRKVPYIHDTSKKWGNHHVQFGIDLNRDMKCKSEITVCLSNWMQCQQYSFNRLERSGMHRTQKFAIRSYTFLVLSAQWLIESRKWKCQTVNRFLDYVRWKWYQSN